MLGMFFLRIAVVPAVLMLVAVVVRSGRLQCCRGELSFPIAADWMHLGQRKSCPPDELHSVYWRL